MVSYKTRRRGGGPARAPRRDGSASRDRLLAAATAEFAARGFDGAKVDRIAARARLNKAMLYYHFHDKAALYRAVLAAVFETLAGEVEAARAAAADPVGQLHNFIRTAGTLVRSHPEFCAIWLREIAEGGRHLDPATITRMRDVVGTLAAILALGQRRGAFRVTNPFVTQLSIVGPLLMFAASAPLRARLRGALPAAVSDASFDAVIDQVEASVVASLAVAPLHPVGAGTTHRTRECRS